MKPLHFFLETATYLKNVPFFDGLHLQSDLQRSFCSGQFSTVGQLMLIVSAGWQSFHAGFKSMLHPVPVCVDISKKKNMVQAICTLLFETQLSGSIQTQRNQQALAKWHHARVEHIAIRCMIVEQGLKMAPNANQAFLQKVEWPPPPTFLHLQLDTMLQRTMGFKSISYWVFQTISCKKSVCLYPWNSPIKWPLWCCSTHWFWDFGLCPLRGSTKPRLEVTAMFFISTVGMTLKESGPSTDGQ